MYFFPINELPDVWQPYVSVVASNPRGVTHIAIEGQTMWVKWKFKTTTQVLSVPCSDFKNGFRLLDLLLEGLTNAG